MATLIRPQISEKNKYYIDKHRYYELKHFCLQYNEWKKSYTACDGSTMFASGYDQYPTGCQTTDLTAKYAIKRAHYAERIEIVEKAAMDADEFLYPFILKGVTEGLSYTYLKTKLEIPCGRDMYYDRYRKFFWLLSEARN